MNLLAYDESALRARLAELSVAQRTLFAASVAERWLPAYRAFAENTGRAGIGAVRDALDLAWRPTLSPVDYRSASDAADRVQAFMPDGGGGGDFSADLPVAANACAAVFYALRTVLTIDVQDAVRAARQGYEAADYLAELRLDSNPALPGGEGYIRDSPEVQSELAAQAADLELLSQARTGELRPDESLARSVCQLRGRWAAEPSRAEVRRRLHDLLRGHATADEVATWARPWVVTSDPIITELAVWEALTSLSGADIRVSKSDYLHGDPDFQSWLEALEGPDS